MSDKISEEKFHLETVPFIIEVNNSDPDLGNTLKITSIHGNISFLLDLNNIKELMRMSKKDKIAYYAIMQSAFVTAKEDHVFLPAQLKRIINKQET
jgi:hypothetical protein